MMYMKTIRNMGGGAGFDGHVSQQNVVSSLRRFF